MNESSLTAGTVISHYHILSRIGVGGMGEVYLAEDTRLGRKVALKVLPAEFTKDKGRLQRFEQEAKTASALNHPNIVTIHEIGQVVDVHFMVTEHIEGETLRQRFAHTRMTLQEVLETGIQVASALAAAHKAGIIHRDIKPENIMRREDGLVKVLDFGLAKLTERQAPSAFPEAPTVAKVDTDPGTLMGTANYMSPEQARGLVVDARTDIFSLGAVLYEMIAGRAPFEGATSSDVIVSILEKEPAPLARYSREVPEALEWMVTKALTKDRDGRYQTVKEFLTDLKKLRQRLEFEQYRDRDEQYRDRKGVEDQSSRSAAIAQCERQLSGMAPEATSGGQEAVGTVKQPVAGNGEVAAARPVSSAEYLVSEIKRHKKSVILALATLVTTVGGIVYLTYLAGGGKAIDSIAVLPFANASGDPNAEYLSDGITENLINSLSQLPKLRVVPRTLAFAYKGRETDPRKVGRELNVRAVLMGRVVQRGDTLNIQTELVDVAEVSQLWGQQYSRKLSDIIVIQEEISKAVSEKLRLRPTGEEQKRLTKRYTENPEAHQLYLKGRYLWNRRTAQTLQQAATYFQQAIDKDPGYALAWAGLADCYALYSFYGVLSPGEAFPKAKEAAAKALEIDDTLAEAHASLAYVKGNYEWDWPGAEREFKRAIDLNPNYATAYHWYATGPLDAMGRQDEALAMLKRAEEMEPLSLIISTIVGRTLYFARQYDQAVEQVRRVLDTDANFPPAHLCLGLAYEQKGMFEEAIAEFQKGSSLSGGEPRIVAALGHAYAVSGRKDRAQNVLVELKQQSRRRYVAPFDFAVIYIGLGEKEQAFEWLEKAYRDHSPWLDWLKADPRFDSLHGDSRYRDLRQRMGLPP